MKRTTFMAISLAAALGASFAIANSWNAKGESNSALMSELNKGNSRFADGKNAFPHTGSIRRKETAKGQEPFATVLTCADSRVSPEFIFDQGIGDLFSIRVAGAVADTDEIGTIEYGVGHLKTPILIVMGHTKCGAVKAVCEGAEVSQNIRWLVDNIVPAVQRAKHEHPKLQGDSLVDAAVEQNVAQSIQDILQRSKEVRERVAEGELTIYGAVYDIESGKVRWLGQKGSSGHKASGHSDGGNSGF